MTARNGVDVSVVLPVYNGEESIVESLESVLRQEGPSFEVVVVDDGSTDGTANLLEQYSGRERVRIVQLAENSGLPTALNRGIEAADGTYIMRQDADDRSHPGRMANQFEYLEAHPSVAVLGTAANVIDDDGDVLYEHRPDADPATVLDDRNPMVHGSIMVRREPVEDVGGYDEFFRFCQDYDFYRRLVAAGYDIDMLNEIHYDLRREEGVDSVEKRSQLALYSAVARLPPDHRDDAISVAESAGLESVYDVLPREEQARYDRRLVRSHVEQGNRLAAAKHAVRATRLDPFSIRTAQHLFLAAAPFAVGTWILSHVQGR